MADLAPERALSRIIRLGVLTVVGLATVALGLSATAWFMYRADHTVIRNATVKGRVHRIGARIDGQVKRVEVQPGQRVAKGDVLFRLEDEHLQAALRAAQSELNVVSKRYEAEKLAIEHERRRLQLEMERCESELQAATAEVEAAVSNREKLQREFERVQSLVKNEVSAASEMDRVRAERDHASALLKTARGRREAAESTCGVARVQFQEGLRVREAGLAVVAAEVDQARARVSSVEADLAATVVRAPEQGWVGERIIETGGSARVGNPILSLWIGTPWIEAWAHEKHLSRITLGSPVDVTLTAFPGRKLHGQVEALGVLADKELHPQPVPAPRRSLFSQQAKVPIRVAIAADELRLQPGLTALVGIQDTTRATPVHLARWLDRILAAILQTSFDSKQINQKGTPP